MRRILVRIVWLLAGMLCAALGLEAALRLAPVASVLHRTGDAARWPLQNMSAGQPWSYSWTWAMLNAHAGRANNYGHVSPFDFQKDSHAAIVIGDSFVESLMNDYADSLQGQLGRRLGAPERVYGLGVSGLSASDYLALARQAGAEFKPSAAVFVITDGDLSESLIRRDGAYFLERRDGALALAYRPAPGRGDVPAWRRALAESALRRYLQVNLQFTPDKLLLPLQAAHAGPRDAAPAVGGASLAEQRDVADWFLRELPASLGLAPGCIALLVDTDRYAIYKPELATTRKDAPEARRYLIERARGLGFGVSDLDAVFRDRFAREHLRFDHYPVDRHWNRVGHGVAADEAYRLLYDGAKDCRAPR